MTIRLGTSLSLVLVLPVAAALILARASGADDPAAEVDPVGKHFWVDTATVVDVDPESGLFRVMSRAVGTTYAVDDGTLIRKGGETISLEGLEPGARVAISAHEGLRVGDLPVADTVQVVAVDPATGEPRTRATTTGGEEPAPDPPGATPAEQ